MKRLKLIALLALIAAPLLSVNLGCKATADKNGTGVKIGDPSGI